MKIILVPGHYLVGHDYLLLHKQKDVKKIIIYIWKLFMSNQAIPRNQHSCDLNKIF